MKILKTKLLLAFFISGFFLFGLAGVSEATTYFVKPAGEGGSDSNTGLSDAQAWATISKVNGHSFQTGDNVFFKCGGAWTGRQLRIDWGGNASNRVTIGAYHGSGTIGVSGNKPVIDGNNIAPTMEYAGLIHSDKNDYITIENFRVINSTWDAVRMQGESSSANNVSNNVYNIDTSGIWKVGVKYHYIDTGIVEGCDVTDCARTSLYSYGWPAVLVATRSNNIIIRNNIVHENYGEGIGIYTNSNNCVVEDNIVYANEQLGIYIDHSRGNTIRRNLVYGTTDPTFWRSGFSSVGIAIADEAWASPYSENNRIHNNLVAYSANGIALWAADGWPLKNTFVYNNIVVDCGTNLFLSGSRTLYESSAIKNNIFWSISGDSVQATVPSSHVGLTLDNNLWSSVPDIDARGANDPAYAIPKLTKTTGWRSLTAGSLNGSEFTLQPTSLAINAGTNLGAPYNQGLNSASTWVNNISTLNQNDYDNWEIGAFVFADVAIPDPDPDPPIPTCSDSGTCCPTGWICDGGPGENLPGCSNVCCIGGTCAPAPATSVCQNEGYKCCSSCKLDPQSEYDESCAGGVCCAVCTPAAIPPLGEVGIKNPTKTADFAQIVENTIIWALSIIGSLALLTLIIGGVMYMGSAGDEQKVLTAKKIVTYAIIGLILILLSYSIIVALSEILS